MSYKQWSNFQNDYLPERISFDTRLQSRAISAAPDIKGYGNDHDYGTSHWWPTRGAAAEAIMASLRLLEIL